MVSATFLRKPWVWVIVVVGAILIVFTLLPEPSDDAVQAPLNEFPIDVTEDRVERIEVDGNDVEYQVSGRPNTFHTRIEDDDTLREVLLDTGVSPEEFPTITVHDPSFWDRLILLPFMFLPWILIIAILVAILRWIWTRARDQAA